MLEFKHSKKSLELRIKIVLNVISTFLKTIHDSELYSLNASETSLLTFLMMNSKDVQKGSMDIKGYISPEYFDIYSTEFEVERYYVSLLLTHLKRKGYITLNPVNKKRGRCLSPFLIKVLNDLKTKESYEVRI